MFFQSIPNYHDSLRFCKADPVYSTRADAAHRVSKLYNNADMRSLSERLAEARKAKGFSQQELAKRAKCSQSLIGNLEAGRQKDSTKIPQIAAALGVTALWLSEERGPRDAGQAALQEVKASGIDAAFLSRCLTAVDNWLEAQRKASGQDERIARACDLYSVFNGHDASVETMRAFIERWDAVVRAQSEKR